MDDNDFFVVSVVVSEGLYAYRCDIDLTGFKVGCVRQVTVGITSIGICVSCGVKHPH